MGSGSAADVTSSALSARSASSASSQPSIILFKDSRGSSPSSSSAGPICPAAIWREAEAAGAFRGAGIDLPDGYIHFSTAAQVRETAAKHFAGIVDLVLVAVDADAVAADLRWEPARGDLFPHLYAELPVAAVAWVRPLALGADGQHVFPVL